MIQVAHAKTDFLKTLILSERKFEEILTKPCFRFLLIFFYPQISWLKIKISKN